MKFFLDYDLTNWNSYRIKSKCKKAIFFDFEDEIVDYFATTDSNYRIIGAGNNIILSKNYYLEDFLIFNGNFSKIESNEDGLLIVESGASMQELSSLALLKGLSGLEMFYDIPSSLGGAVVMNAGAGGHNIGDMLLKVRYLDLSKNEIVEIERENVNFSYRNSLFQKDLDKFVLKAWLKLEKGDPAVIKDNMDSMKIARWSKQPKEYPNAGSVFKRPSGHYVGALIEELNLKGFSLGGAKVSEKHGGFIVNYNNATGQDILSLISEIKNRVKDAFGIELEVEQRVI